MRNVIAGAALTATIFSTNGVAAQTREATPAQVGPQQLRELKELRYQIRQMEGLLEGAVEHGAAVMRDGLRLVLPTDMLLAEEARARGFRLEGYGIFFDVEVPSLQGPLPWSFQALDQSNLGIQSALQTLRSFVDGRGANDVNVQQALRRVEVQMAPMGGTSVSDAGVVGTDRQGSAEAQPVVSQQQANQAYRETISIALMDAMLEHSRGLNVGQGEWLSIAARGIGDRPRPGSSDTDGQTWLISVRGSDLKLFLGGELSREDALKRVSVRVF